MVYSRSVFRVVTALAVVLGLGSCSSDLLVGPGGEGDGEVFVAQGKPAAPVHGNFRAHLSGAEEVPAADTRAQGQAIFRLSADGLELSYKLIVANITDVRMAHIHLAPKDANGPVVAWLYPDAPPPALIPGRFDGVLAEGTITADKLVGPLAGMALRKLVDALAGGDAYVNVHTLGFPAGEIRGQVF